MENIVSYNSSSDDDEDNVINNNDNDHQLPPKLLKLTKSSAPVILETLLKGKSLESSYTSNNNTNLMMMPQQGPDNISNSSSNYHDNNHHTGIIENTYMDAYTFKEHVQSFQKQDSHYNRSVPMDINMDNIYAQTIAATKIRKEEALKMNDQTSSSSFSSSSIDLGDEFDGPWAPMLVSHSISDSKTTSTATTTAATTKEIIENTTGDKNEEKDVIENSNIATEEEVRKQLGYEDDTKDHNDYENKKASTKFHGKSEYDYQGRPWTHPPAGLRAGEGDHDCIIPKKCVKKFIGHRKGVQNIQFLPNIGHLLLSASLDGECKMWDVLTERKVMRTYSGHSGGVKSIHINSDSTEFLSSSFDRKVRLWDIETGQVQATFNNGKIGNQIQFYPRNNNIFVMAASDNRVYSWDIRSGEVVQEYNYHLKAANAICFFEDGRKFLSTSDDKKIHVWEWDIPVPIKTISEPEMCSMPYVAIHPSHSYIAGQHMDNTIVTYSCEHGKVKQVKKKTFSGLHNAGYACQLDFSPNGKLLCSGDGQGHLLIWDWNGTKLLKKFKVHDSVCMGAIWHPLRPSLIATCGWDGSIKLWE